MKTLKKGERNILEKRKYKEGFEPPSFFKGGIKLEAKFVEFP